MPVKEVFISSLDERLAQVSRFLAGCMGWK